MSRKTKALKRTALYRYAWPPDTYLGLHIRSGKLVLSIVDSMMRALGVPFLIIKKP